MAASRARLQQRFKELLENYGHIERMRPRDQKTAAAAFLTRAALTTIKRALQLRPGDKVNETILDQIRKDQGVPWYKRLFVN